MGVMEIVMGNAGFISSAVPPRCSSAGYCGALATLPNQAANSRRESPPCTEGKSRHCLAFRV